MRICILSELFYPYLLGGAERRYWEIAKRLAKKGHDVTVFSLKFPGYPDEETVEGIKIKRVGKKHPLTHRDAKKLASYWPAGFGAAASEFDIVDANQGAGTFIGLWKFLRLTKRPVVVTFHDIYWRNWPGYWGIAGRYLGAILELGWFVMAKAASRVIVNSNQTKEKLGVFGVKNPEVIVSGVDLETVRKVKPIKSAKTIVYVGRLETYKRVDVLIKAMALSKKLRGYKLLVMGRGPDQKRLERIANESKVRAEFLGFVSEEEKIARIKGADVLVNPSALEGLGLILLEGMACGVPVVGFDLECYKEFCTTENSVIVKEFSEGALSEGIETALSSRSLARNGAKTAEKFSWDGVADKVEKVYKELLNKASN